MSVTVNASTGIVTSSNTSQLNIVTQTGAHGWNATTNAAQTMAGINRITIHYTGANVDGPSDMTLAGLNATWSGAGWHHGGYHFVIRTDGTVWQIGRINRTSNGAGGQNANNIHISIMGLFWDGVSERPRRNNGTLVAGAVQPSAAQRTAVQRLVQGLLNNATLSGISNANHVFGHRHLPNQSTYCPGMTRANVQALVSGGSAPAPTPPAGGSGTHTVQAGQTLFSIAQMHGTTVAVLQQLNNMGTSTVLQVGQVLRLPGSGRTHTVQAGQTLFGIAQLHGTTVAILQQLNNMGTSTVLQVGQILRLP